MMDDIHDSKRKDKKEKNKVREFGSVIST